jgi:hypothetical protein
MCVMAPLQTLRERCTEENRRLRMDSSTKCGHCAKRIGTGTDLPASLLSTYVACMRRSWYDHHAKHRRALKLAIGRPPLARHAFTHTPHKPHNPTSSLTPPPTPPPPPRPHPALPTPPGDSAFALTPGGGVLHYSCFHARSGAAPPSPFAPSSPAPAPGTVPALDGAALSPLQAGTAAAAAAATATPGAGRGGSLGNGGGGVGDAVARVPPPPLDPVSLSDARTASTVSGGTPASASGGGLGFGFGGSGGVPALGTPVGGRSGRKGRVSVVVTATAGFDANRAEWDIAREKSRGSGQAARPR